MSEITIDLTGDAYRPQGLQDTFSVRVLRKAYELLGHQNLKPRRTPKGSWWVGSFRSLKSYRVIAPERGPAHDYDPIPENISCSCDNGVKKRGKPHCYHAAAVLIELGWK